MLATCHFRYSKIWSQASKLCMLRFWHNYDKTFRLLPDSASALIRGIRFSPFLRDFRSQK